MTVAENNNSTAYLSNNGECTVFSFGEMKITFLTGKRLESDMDPVEEAIALQKWKINAEFMEEEIAQVFS